MKKLMICLASTFSIAAAPADPASQISAVNAKWTQAVAKKDMATVEAIVAPQFRLTWGGADRGEVVERATWLSNLRKMQIANYETRVSDVETHGDTAVATVSGSWDVEFDGQKRAEKFRLIDVWVRNGSNWQVVRRHITSPE